MDSLQWAGVGCSLLQIILLLVFYGDNVYVSDVLARVVPYKILVTVFVFAQAVLFGMFLWRIRFEQRVTCILGAVAVVVYASGWIMLSIEWNDSSVAHRAGAGIFMLGMGAEALLMIGLCRRHMVQMLVMVGLFLGGLVSGIMFVYRFYTDGGDAWIFEHWSFIAVIGIQLAFFLVQSPRAGVRHNAMPRIDPSDLAHH